MKQQNLFLKISTVYVFLFLGIASTFPFLTVYLQGKGLSNTQIGIAYAMLNITSIIIQPIWGFITDRYSNRRTMLILISFLNAVMIINFVLANHYFYVIVCVLLLAIFQSALVPITDAHVYGIIEQNKHLQYGRMRLMGSIGFAVGALVFGLVIKSLGINAVFYTYIFVMIILGILYYKIEFKGESGRTGATNLKNIGTLVKNKKLILLLLTVLAAAVSMGSNNTYITVLIQETGGDVSKLGVMWFILAMSQIPLMFYGAKLINRFGELNLLVASMFLFCIRYYLDSVCTSYLMVILVQLMDSITFTVYFIAVLHYLNKITPPDLKTLVMTLFAATGGVGALIGNVSGGIIVDAMNVFILYKIIAIISLIAMTFAILLKRYDKGQKMNYKAIE